MNHSFRSNRANIVASALCSRDGATSIKELATSRRPPSGSVVLTLAEQGKTAEEINAKIPPYDLNWTISILNDALNHDWVERMDTDSE